ncbi:MAG: chondroitinase-B domain-containing protein [Opitutaceae bacterium]
MESKSLRLILSAAFLVVSSSVTSTLNAVTHNVSNAAQFNALPTLNAGDIVLLADGNYGELDKTLSSSITDDAIAQSNPVIVMATTAGGVDVTAPSRITLDGRGIILAGLDFVAGSGMIDNGTTSPAALITMATDSRYMTLTNVRFLNCISGDDYGHWIDVRGFYNKIEYCTFEGKDEPVRNATIGFKRATSEAGIATPRGHILRRCYFGPRECSTTENGYETIRIGDSSSQAHDMQVVIEENVFYRAIWRADTNKPNDMEIISNKTKGNIIRNNTFLESYGQITLRHGDACTVEGNFIFGGGYYDTATSIALNATNGNQSGIRIIGQDHVVRNNYLVNLDGTNFRAALCLMGGEDPWDDGDGSGGDNGYEPAHNAQIYNNTFIDCKEMHLGYLNAGSTLPTGVQIYNNAWQGKDSGSSNGIVREGSFTPSGSGGNYIYHDDSDYGWNGLGGTYSSSTSPDITDDFEQFKIPASGSPLLNAANATLVATDDIRQLARPASNKDIGCYEREVAGSGARPLMRGEVGPGFDGGPAGTYPVIGNTTPVIATTTLALGTVGAAYIDNLVTSGGDAPFVWSLTAGSLPAGISLATDGTLSGTPTVVGVSTFTVKVVDDDSEEDSKELTLTIDPVSVDPAKFVIGNSDVIASADDGNVPSNTLDGNPNTRWAAQGDGQWIRYDLGEVKNVHYLKISFYKGNERTTNFDIEVSNNDSTWTPLSSGVDSSGTTTELETFDIPNTQARYVRIVGHGNSSPSLWNSLTRVEIWGTVVVAVPEVPTGLAATPSDGEVSLSWSAASGATSYNVKRSETDGSGYSTIASEASNGYVDSAVTNDTTYYYVISAVNGSGESADSTQASATPIAPPAIPTGLAATPSDGEVSLNWSAASGATSYKVKRSETDGSGYSTIASEASNGYVDSAVTNDTTYYYVISAVNGSGESADSTQASATPIAPPAIPTGLAATPSDGEVSLSWSAASGATSYNVKRSETDGSGYSTIASEASNGYVDSAVTNDTTYYYVISAVNGSGESADSTQASATPIAPPSIPTGLAATPSDGEVSLSWNAVSGATSYKVKRSETDGSGYSTIASEASNGYVDSAVTNGTVYYYVVSAENGSGESADSAQVSAKPFAPIAPEELVGPAISFAGDDIDITFQSVVGRVYQLQKTDALDPTDWMNIGDEVIGTGAEMVLQDATAALILKRFYRLVVQP